ncbi:MAG: hypothetical protein OXI41_06790 [Chloroflexota bacterium]|nr:hypothetical protein [Chloroflexota bacterium]MDE2894376.1 hypothetical protein [Chloroflexota bacterium]
MPDQNKIQFQHKGGFGFIERDSLDTVRVRFEDIPPHRIFSPLGDDEGTGMMVFLELSLAQARALGAVLLQDRSTDPA